MGLIGTAPRRCEVKWLHRSFPTLYRIQPSTTTGTRGRERSRERNVGDLHWTAL